MIGVIDWIERSGCNLGNTLDKLLIIELSIVIIPIGLTLQESCICLLCIFDVLFELYFV